MKRIAKKIMIILGIILLVLLILAVGVYQFVLQYPKLKENPTIGIILCRDKNNAVVEMTLPEDNLQIFASKYETVLPSKEALQKLLQEQLSDEDESSS